MGRRMGLVLYAVLILFGIRGMPFKRAAFFCVVTAAILTALAIGGINDLPGCNGVSCPTAIPTLAETFLLTIAIAFGCFGAGFVAHWLMRRAKS
jgi:hypothetical protein